MISNKHRIILRLAIFIALFLPFNVQAHESVDHNTATPHLDPIALLSNRVHFTEENGYLVMKSNGIPNHTTGNFPNRSNPNSISAQNHIYRIPLSPTKNTSAREKSGAIGVALNGVPIEPGTAECYGRSRGQRGPMETCAWREEAIVNGQGLLGLDFNNAHVQPTGSYHYHGVPNGLIKNMPAQTTDIIHVGYAADGFKIYVSRANKLSPSYRLKQGTRPSGPGGQYDGTYTADYEYISNMGALDECNGTEINGRYSYVLTASFPYAPRCLMGKADPSFERKGRNNAQNSNESRQPPLRYRR